MTRVFFDTNVLIYATDRDAGVKRRMARKCLKDCLSAGTMVLSTQVLQEFFVIATGKLAVSKADAKRLVELLCRVDIVQISPEMICRAIDLHQVHSVSFWDALILSSARAADAAICLSEDMQHERVVDGVQVINPFR